MRRFTFIHSRLPFEMTTDRFWGCRTAGVALLALAATLPPATSVHAGERQLDFVHALAEHNYHDLAQFYLDRLQSGGELPEELRQVLPYEEAILLLGQARSEQDLVRREKQLDEARRKLEQFLAASPNHPRAAEAGKEFGKLKLERGRVALAQSQLPANRARRQALGEQARRFFEEARRTLDAALEQYESQLKELTRQIHAASENDSKVVEARDAIDRAIMQAKLDRALSQYEFAQTHDRGSKPFVEALEQAAGEFEQVYIEYRTQIVGLYARMWQGRCFQELGEPNKALGFYRELLEAAAGDQQREAIAPLERLRDNVLYFRLVSLNDPDRGDYDVVISEAEPWRGRKRRSLETEVGLGISLELARAYEGLARKKPPGGERDQLLGKAARVAREIAGYDGPHQGAALAMADRLGDRARRDAPQGFDDLLDAARVALTDGMAALDADQPSPETAHDHFAEALRLARNALNEVRPNTAVGRVNEARLVLCHASYQLGRNYDAAVVGEFLARQYPDSGLAANAAGVALAAFLQEYQRPENPAPASDLAHLVNVANLIVESWPDSPEAERASMTLGAVYQQQGRAEDAAKWYLAIEPDSARYAEAQQKAGMAYWDAYLRAAALAPGERPDKAGLDDLRQRAQQLLERGIAGMQATADGISSSSTLTAARLSLAQVYLEQSEFRRALSLVEPLVTSIDGTAAAEDGRFALETYKAALRCYVGVRDLDAAERMMTRIESLESSDQAGIVQVYQQLGQELEREVERRRASGDAQGLAEMLSAFEAFLDRIAGRGTGQTFESLAWTGDAYNRLAEGLGPSGARGANDPRVHELFGKAADIFRRILDGEASGATAPSEGSLLAIRLRLAHCLRRRQEFSEAVKVVGEVLRANPRAVDAQREGAYIYQDWAEAEGGYWNQAMAGSLPIRRGEATSNLIWGWATLAQLLQPSATPGTPYYALWHEARYNQAYCRYRQALEESDPQRRLRQLQLAQRDVRFTTRLSSDQGGPEWKAKFEALDRNIRQALAR